MIQKMEFSFNSFLGIEQQRLFSSLFNIGKIGWLVPAFEGLYDGLEYNSRTSKIQILIYYSRFYFYHSMASFLRGHYSTAYANLRNAIEACLHHHNIHFGAYTIEQFVAAEGPYKSVKKIAKEIVKKTKSDEHGINDLVNSLSERHHFASRYGSHADPMSFEHRLHKDSKTGHWSFLFVQSKKVDEVREDCLKLMNAFVDVVDLHRKIDPPNREFRGAIFELQIASLRSSLSKLADPDVAGAHGPASELMPPESSPDNSSE
jgi:hypothetical protein